MELRIWRSFSCNNSSSYYLVAQFETAEAAAASASELSEFFAAHGKQIDDRIAANDYSDDLQPSDAEKALAAKHGFEPDGYLRWGDEALSWWLPTATAIGEDVLVQHAYCGGFGGSIPRYFDAIGARAGEQSRERPMLSVRLEVPDGGDELRRELETYLNGLRETADDEDGWVYDDTDNPPPWGGEATSDMEFKSGVPFPAYTLAGQIGFALPVNPDGIGEITAYFEERGVADYHLALNRYADVLRFRAVTAATCSACESRDQLRFVGAGESDAPADQMLCEACGGMFELSEAS